MNITTPSRQVATTNSLQSTPQSAGSASRGKDVSITGLRDVNPWIAKDTENAQLCELDEMLKSFLLDCMVSQSATMEDPSALFKSCIQKVLPICNGTHGNALYLGIIRKSLEIYSQGSLEAHLYPAFVRVANAALLALHDLDGIDSLYNPSDHILFHVNDREMTQSHEVTSTCKPDVVLVSTADVEARCYHKDKHDMYFEVAARKLGHGAQAFQWRNVRSAIEFKTGAMKPPPTQYTNSKYNDSRASRKYLSLKQSDESGLPTASLAAYHQQQPGSEGKGSTPESVEGPCRTLKRKSTTRGYDQGGSGAESSQATGSSKRQKVTSAQTDPYKVHPMVQTGMYGAELFASQVGRQHAFCLTIVGDLLYLWRYDRQRVIQCSALNFIQDLPRFLVLLLAMQRFKNHHWGLHPTVDPVFGELAECTLNSPAVTTVIDNREVGQVDIAIDLSSENRVGHYGLVGRATNVLPVTSKKFALAGNLVVKLSWAEESRTSEPDILKEVYRIAEHELDVQGHVPEMVFYHKFSECCTARIRKHLNLSTEGARILYLIIFRELLHITRLTDEPLLDAWWDTVKCHLALWRNGVRHRDVSATNLMYRVDEQRVIGVLNDFDLATIVEGVTGNQRTGTVPFMAIELLTERGRKGLVKHVYVHEAESFIWVLSWICLRYSDGQLREHDRPLDGWLKTDSDGCRKEKLDFLHFHGDLIPGNGHERSWLVAKRCLKAFRYYMVTKAESPTDEAWAGPFKELLEGPYRAVRTQ